jgi:hypothetical protein
VSTGVPIVKSKLFIGLGCVVLSLSAFADEPVGGLEGMVYQMEKHGATSDLQVARPFERSAPSSAQASQGPTENPVTRVITPGSRALKPQTPTRATEHIDRQGSVTVTAQQPVQIAVPAPARHNPLADQPLAAGGLEQIINIMELNASSPMRVSNQAAARPGIQGEASLSEKMAR